MEEKQPEKAVKAKDPKGNAYDWLESLVTAIVACIIIFLFLFRVVNVQGSSMVPTLREADMQVIELVPFGGTGLRIGQFPMGRDARKNG